MKRVFPGLIALLLTFSAVSCALTDTSSSAGGHRETDTTAVTFSVSGDTTVETEPDMSAPDFSVLNADGDTVRLSDFEGKPVVLNFWASWCPPCKSEMPDFQDVFEAYGENVHFVMVNLTDGTRETVAIAKAFIADKGYTFPIYFDTASEAASAYGIYSIPTTFFIDAEGNMVTYAQGALDAATLKKGIDMIADTAAAGD